MNSKFKFSSLIVVLLAINSVQSWDDFKDRQNDFDKRWNEGLETHEKAQKIFFVIFFIILGIIVISVVSSLIFHILIWCGVIDGNNVQKCK
jgi:hypothetical protein